MSKNSHLASTPGLAGLAPTRLRGILEFAHNILTTRASLKFSPRVREDACRELMLLRRTDAGSSQKYDCHRGDTATLIFSIFQSYAYLCSSAGVSSTSTSIPQSMERIHAQWRTEIVIYESQSDIKVDSCISIWHFGAFSPRLVTNTSNILYEEMILHY